MSTSILAAPAAEPQAVALCLVCGAEDLLQHMAPVEQYDRQGGRLPDAYLCACCEDDLAEGC